MFKVGDRVRVLPGACYVSFVGKEGTVLAVHEGQPLRIDVDLDGVLAFPGGWPMLENEIALISTNANQ